MIDTVIVIEIEKHVIMIDTHVNEKIHTNNVE